MRLFKGVMLFMFVSVAALFASTPTDSLGQVSNQIVDFLTKFVGSEQALVVYSGITVLILTGIQNLLKYCLKHFVPTKYGKYGKYAYPLIMRLLSKDWLLGKSILRYNSKFDPNLSMADKQELAEKIKAEVKEEIRKKYPLFNIDIKDPK